MEINLEQYFSGDKSWKRFVAVFKEDWEKFDRKEDLINSLKGNIEFAVVFSSIDDRPFDFIHEKMELLDGISPVECLGDDVLENRLKVFLMQRPD